MLHTCTHRHTSTSFDKTCTFLKYFFVFVAVWFDILHIFLFIAMSSLVYFTTILLLFLIFVHIYIHVYITDLESKRHNKVFNLESNDLRSESQFLGSSVGLQEL